MTAWIGVAACVVSTAAAFLPVRRAAFVAALVVGAVTWIGLVGQDGVDPALPLAAACAFLFVLALRQAVEGRRRAQELLAAERATRAARVAGAAAAERARLARDLHDGLTHLLTGQLLVLRTAAAALTDHEPVAAGERIGHAVALAQQALLEARDVVDVLRGSAPDLGSVRRTVQEWARATGRSVRVRLPGEAPELDGAAWGALLATLREALTNVTRHAGPGDVRVELDSDRDGVCLVVENDTPPHPAGALPGGGGVGLQGLRERAALAGGHLSAGPGPAGWRLGLTLPRAAPALDGRRA